MQKYALFKIIRALKDISQDVSIRSISKKASVSTATGKACMDYLLQKGILTKDIVRNTFQFKK